MMRWWIVALCLGVAVAGLVQQRQLAHREACTRAIAAAIETRSQQLLAIRDPDGWQEQARDIYTANPIPQC